MSSRDAAVSHGPWCYTVPLSTLPMFYTMDCSLTHRAKFCEISKNNTRVMLAIETSRCLCCLRNRPGYDGSAFMLHLVDAQFGRRYKSNAYPGGSVDTGPTPLVNMDAWIKWDAEKRWSAGRNR